MSDSKQVSFGFDGPIQSNGYESGVISSGATPSSTFDWKHRFTKSLRYSPGSIKASVFTLLTATIGSGVLALPYGMRQSGLVPTLILIVGGALAAYFAVWQIITASMESGRGGQPRAKSYQELAVRSSGPRLEKFTKWTLIVNLFMTTVAYMVVIGTLVPAAVQAMVGHDILDEWYMQRWFILLVHTCCIEVPLGLQDGIGALRYAMIVALFWSTYLATVTVYEYTNICGTGDGAGPCLRETLRDESVVWGPLKFQGFVTTVPIIVFSYTCHPAVLPVYLQLMRPSSDRMFTVTKATFILCVVIYALIATFGYLTFRNQVLGDFLLNNYRHHKHILAAGFGLVASVSCSIPIFIHTAKFNFMQSRKSKKRRARSDPVADSDDGYEALEEDSDDDDDAEPLATDATFCERMNHPRCFTKWMPLMWLGLSYAIASSISDLAAVIGIMGSTTLPVISYLLPCLFMWGTTEREEYWTQKIVASFITVFIGFFCIVNLGYQIYGFTQ